MNVKFIIIDTPGRRTYFRPGSVVEMAEFGTANLFVRCEGDSGSDPGITFNFPTASARDAAVHEILKHSPTVCTN